MERSGEPGDKHRTPAESNSAERQEIVALSLRERKAYGPRAELCFPLAERL